MSFKFASAAAVVALVLTSIDPSGAQPTRVKSGVLDCDVSGGFGWIIGSQKSVQCLFMPDQPGPREQYIGLITKFGLDVGATTGGRMVWGVYGGNNPRRGGAAGGYTRGA